MSLGYIKMAELPAVTFTTPPQSQNQHAHVGLQGQ
nr:MAG TPA: hypothetical protein [Caudoviricetes sp.]